MPTVIALHGNRPGAGKSTVAGILKDLYGYKSEKVATPLKRMMGSLGCTYYDIEGHLKETPNDKLCGLTPRRFMQSLGRELPDSLGRPELWGEMWLQRARENGYSNIVVDDHRFPYEMKYFMKYGTTIIMNATHASR